MSPFPQILNTFVGVVGRGRMDGILLARTPGLRGVIDHGWQRAGLDYSEREDFVPD